MTVVAVKDGIMAADSAMSRDDRRYSMAPGQTKITRTDLGLFGGAGPAPDTYKMREWILGDMIGRAPRSSYPEAFLAAPNADAYADFLWLKFDGTLWRTDLSMDWFPVPSPMAIGSAYSFVEGAMWAGLSAPDAVALAIRCCDRVGGSVQVEKL